MVIRAFFFSGILPALFFQSAIASEVTLPCWVSDNMMLPAGIPFKITGMAEPHKTVTVNFGSVSATATTDDCGSWIIEFPAVETGMKGELVFTCNSEKKVISDVATGDVWLCSGQSNMQRRVANPDAARGGTSIDAWIPGNAFPDNGSGRLMRSLINDPEVLKAVEDDQVDFRPAGQHRLVRWGLGRAVPASLYEQLIKPFNDLSVRGVVWYQGESNANTVEQAKEYRLWLCNLVSEYRKLWGNPALPFVIIQLPSYDPGTPRGRKA